MPSDPDAAPINRLPAGVIVLALPMVVVELVLSAGIQGYLGGPGAVGWRLEAIRDWGFSGPLLAAMAEAGRWPAGELARIVTYPFVHLGFLHLVMALVFLLALGKMVGDVFGSLALVVLFFGSSVAGALVFAALGSDPVPLVGAYPGVYGLVGAFTFLLWVRLGAEGAPQIGAFTLIGVLLFIQLVFGLLFGTGQDWIAEVAGFAAGFALSVVLAPGGWARVLARLRRR